MVGHVLAASMVLSLVAATGDPGELVAGWIQTSALVAFSALFALGLIVAKPTLERLVVAPLQDRIAALEKANEHKDEQYQELVGKLAAALEAQSRMVDQLLKDRRGG